MKNSCISILLIFFAITVFAQAPESISYQAIARDASGNLIPNHPVSFRLSILRGSSSGDLVFKETHSVTTNSFGLATLEIGKGIVVTGTFSAINWGSAIYWLKTEMDPAGGSSYLLMGTSQFMSVPYALYAKTSGSVSGSGLNTVPALSQFQIDTLNAIAGTVVLNTSSNCLDYFTGSVWKEMCGTCTPQPTQSNAGENQSITGNSTVLSANPPVSGTGHWEIISGTGGSIANPAQANSGFSGNQPGNYTLRWTITSVCGSSSDDVTINFINNPPTSSADMIFAPYVDCTLWPNFEIQNVSTTGISLYTCAFIVDDQFATGANPCWGGYSTLVMDYYQDKIAALRSQGGDIIMSFGGANGIELAYAAADEFAARNAYKTVIDAYNLTSIDFDIEGFLTADAPSILRRSKALKLLQNEYPALKISLTLPVLPSGLTGDGLNVVQSALSQNVTISCVNIMAMDYGGSPDMGNAAISAGEALFVQLKTLYQNAGLYQSDSLIWRKIGITPMIGKNDVQGEIFYQGDATDLAAWAVEKNISRLAMWSVNRDKQCANPEDPLYSCSHVTQTLYEFSGIFGSVAGNPVLKPVKKNSNLQVK